MPKFKSKFNFLLIAISLVVFGFYVFVEALYLFDGGNPIYSWKYLALFYNNSKQDNKKPFAVHPNDAIFINRSVCTKKAINVTLYRNIIGVTKHAITIEKDPIIMPFAKGCNPMNVQFTVPATSTPGTYEYEVKMLVPTLPLIPDKITMPIFYYTVVP